VRASVVGLGRQRRAERNFLDVDIETGVENGRLLATLPHMAKCSSAIKTAAWSSVPVVARHWGRIHETQTEIRPHSNGIPTTNRHASVNGSGQADAQRESEERLAAT
jgi:hypothetical protein